MTYVVYVNHPNNKSIVHSTSCRTYIHRRRDETLNGHWSIIDHEQFETVRDALRYAENTGKRTVDACAFCIG